MARFFRRGVSKIRWITAPSNPAAPTLAEVNAGVALDAALADISGFEFANTPIPVPDLASTFTATIPGEDTTQNPTMTFYDDDTTTTIRTALAKGNAGYVIFAPYGIANTKRAEIWPAKVTGYNDAWTAANEAAKATAGFAITSTPNQAYALPAS